MNEEFINTDQSYRSAEEKALQYFRSLCKQVVEKDYVSLLTRDFQAWKVKHIHLLPFIAIFCKR